MTKFSQIMSDCYIAKESEAKNNLGTISRAQQAHHFERQRFASSFQDLGITTNSKFYDFKISSLSQNQATAVAIPRENELKSFVASIHYDQSNGSYNRTFCYSNKPSKKTLESPRIIGSSFQCPAGTTELR